MIRRQPKHVHYPTPWFVNSGDSLQRAIDKYTRRITNQLGIIAAKMSHRILVECASAISKQATWKWKEWNWHWNSMQPLLRGNEWSQKNCMLCACNSLISMSDSSPNGRIEIMRMKVTASNCTQGGDVDSQSCTIFSLVDSDGWYEIKVFVCRLINC